MKNAALQLGLFLVMQDPNRNNKNRTFFTVFIPTYNRAHTIQKALNSIIKQTFNNYEILIVDDGSIDDTYKVIEEWQRHNSYRVRYRYQKRKGKHGAHNNAVFIARGELMVVLDSDDELLPDCLWQINEAWSNIPEAERKFFAGIGGLCITSDGNLHGNPFPSDILDSDYLEVTRRYGVKGEKRNAIRVDVLKQYVYPVFSGEYHIRPSFIWKRISHHYKFRYINKPLQIVDFAPDGLTRTASTRRLMNVRGLFHYWKDDILDHQHFLSHRELIKHYAEYVRYGLHCGIGMVKQWQEVPDRILWLISLSRALPNYLGDLAKKSCRGID